MTTYTKAHDEGACHLCEDCTKEVFTVVYLEGARAFNGLDTAFEYSGPTVALQFLKDLLELNVLDGESLLTEDCLKLVLVERVAREIALEKNK